MLKIKQEKIEKFYDVLDESSMIYFNKAKKSYLEAMLQSCDNLVHNTIKPEDLMPEDIEELKRLYESLEGDSFNKEEVRRAFVLTLFKAFKHLNVALSDFTPDTIGLLFAHFINILYKKEQSISVLDASCGSGNLLFSMLNNCNVSFSNVYGVDSNSSYINIALHLANLLDYEIEFFNQNNLRDMLIPQVDVVIGDLPIDEENDYLPNLTTVKNKLTYRPYLMVDNLMNYCKPGGHMIYLIPNNFFTHEKNKIIKDIILKESYIQALIELPLDLFKDPEFQKSILVIRKKGEQVAPIKDILMQRFPSFKDKEKVNNAIKQIEQWFVKTTK